MSEYIVSITMENAQEVLIEESQKRPVLIDFWADWCGPCKNLMPVLEKLAEEYQGQFVLAKVNADELNMIAAQFGVRSLPTVLIMKDGQPVDGFTGAQPESEVRNFLDKHLPKSWDIKLEQARVLQESGDIESALPLLREAYQESGGVASICVALAELLTLSKRFDEAEKVLSEVKYVDQDATYEQVKAQLDLARDTQKAPELQALETEHQAKPEDREIAFQLALQYSQHDFHKESLELLFTLLKSDMNFKDGDVKKKFLEIIAVLGKGDPIAAEYQRKMYTLLY